MAQRAKLKLVINDGRAETRVAILEDGHLRDIFFHDHVEGGWQPGLNDICLGRITALDRTLNAAFVDIGAHKEAFLRAKDALGMDGPPLNKNRGTSNITGLLTEGTYLPVQVASEAQGSKGARVTREITLAGRYLVYLPLGQGIKVSHGIKRLAGAENAISQFEDWSAQFRKQTGTGGGCIIRLGAVAVGEDCWQEDALSLHTRWQKIIRCQKERKKPGPLEPTGSFLQSLLIELASEIIGEIHCDSSQAERLARTFYADKKSETTPRITLSADDIFESLDVETQLDEALARKVSLPSGGSLIFDHAEALTVVDVDQGGTPGSNPAESALRANLEAARELARQLRLRRVGGLAVVDFIHMSNRNHRNEVLKTLRAALSSDPVATDVSEFSRFGLVELNRANRRAPLSERFFKTQQAGDGPWKEEAIARSLCRLLDAEMRGGSAASLRVTLPPAFLAWLEGPGAAYCKLYEGPGAPSIAWEAREDFSPDRIEVAKLS